MTQSEIKETINKNNKMIEELMTPDQFILNEKINVLLQQNVELRKQCKHEYVDGYCKWCGQGEN